MPPIPALVLDDTRELACRDVLPDGPVVNVEKLTPGRAVNLPSYLRDLFDAAIRAKRAVALVTCRRTGMPVQADGSHQQHFLVPANANVPTIGMTI